MPTNYTDQFYQIDAAYPPAVGTTLNVVNMVVTDVQDDGVINYRDNPDNSPDYDLLDGEDIMRMYPGDTVTIDTLNHGVITYTGVTIVTASGATYFTRLMAKFCIRAPLSTAPPFMALTVFRHLSLRLRPALPPAS